MLLHEGNCSLGARCRRCTAPSPTTAFHPRRARLQLPFPPGTSGAAPQRVAPTAPPRTWHPSSTPAGPPEGEKSLPRAGARCRGACPAPSVLAQGFGWFLDPCDKSQPCSGWETQTAPGLCTLLPIHAPPGGPGSLHAQVPPKPRRQGAPPNAAGFPAWLFASCLKSALPAPKWRAGMGPTAPAEPTLSPGLSPPAAQGVSLHVPTPTGGGAPVTPPAGQAGQASPDGCPLLKQFKVAGNAPSLPPAQGWEETWRKGVSPVRPLLPCDLAAKGTKPPPSSSSSSHPPPPAAF